MENCSSRLWLLIILQYIEQNYKACFGMLMLQKKYTAPQLEAACKRALRGTRVNYTMIKNILEKSLDKQIPLFDNENNIPPHDNIRVRTIINKNYSKLPYTPSRAKPKEEG